MELVDALCTTGAVRDFLDAPVDDEALVRILDRARFAPSGGNRQGWRVVVVKDPTVRSGVRDIYVAGWAEYQAQRAAGLTPFAPITDIAAEADALERASRDGVVADSFLGDFAENFDTVPALLVVLVDIRMLAAVDRDLDRYTFAGGASVYPFAWSIMLAAREEGLRGVITTIAIRREPTLKKLLNVNDELAVAALIALGHPKSQPKHLKRMAVEEFVTVDRVGGPPFGP